MRNPKDIFKIYQLLYRKLGPQYWWPGESDFEMMVGAILTQNTAWTNVEKAIQNLKKASSLSIQKINELSSQLLENLIHPSGYFSVKAKRLKSLTKWLIQTCQGQIKKLKKVSSPVLRANLLNVHGVGPETADSILLYALGKTTFVVDTYTKRIFSRHGFFAEKAEYHHVKKIFETALPRSSKICNEFHALIVKIGKEFCRKKPLCSICPLENDLLKYANSKINIMEKLYA